MHPSLRKSSRKYGDPSMNSPIQSEGSSSPDTHWVSPETPFARMDMDPEPSIPYEEARRSSRLSQRTHVFSDHYDDDLSSSGSDSENLYSTRKYTRRNYGENDSAKKVLRNREAAQQFRQRQREHLKKLQEEYDRLTEENRRYRERVKRLHHLHQEADNDLTYARAFLEQTMTIAMNNLRQSGNISLLEPISSRA